MESMLRGRDRKLLGLILVVLVLAVGFCIFDGDDDDVDGHAGLDLCLGMLVTALTVVLVARLPLSGSTAAFLLAPVLDVTAHVPAPPPKTARLS
jgi:hypothetical protein